VVVPPLWANAVRALPDELPDDELVVELQRLTSEAQPESAHEPSGPDN
jgi:hypothetical protein